MGQKTIFAERLRSTREQAGLTQAELAEKVKLTATSISAYENSDGQKGKNPTFENASAIAKVLGVSLDWLGGLSDEKITIGGAINGENAAVQLIKSIIFFLNGSHCEITPITHAIDSDGTLIKFPNGTRFTEILNGIGQLYELKAKGLMSEETFRLSIDSILVSAGKLEFFQDFVIDTDEVPF